VEEKKEDNKNYIWIGLIILIILILLYLLTKGG
jgi:LPXTG-motif cell wall-anchored protein